jgi:preprotein translocase subunit YajC
MLISQAYAATSEGATELQIAALNDAPSAMEAFMWNMGLVLMLVLLFYVLLIAPQQRRFKDHSKMLSQLKKGDRVVTSGGLIGKIDQIIDDNEAVVDLGHGTKVTVLRSMIQGKAEIFLKSDKPAAAKNTKNKV